MSLRRADGAAVKWIKLWPDEWLNGTLRFTLDHKQRAVWADVLCLAGRSRIPGVICAGEEGGRLVGYPIEHLAGITLLSPEELSEILALFEAQRRVTVEREHGRLIIRLPNWTKYQTEYTRQARYKAKQKRLRQQATPKGDAPGDAKGDGEVEVEVEEEEEKEGAPGTGAPAAQPARQASPLAFSGQHLQVNAVQDRVLAEAFSWVDRQSQYRKVDSWLEANPNRRPRRASRFLHNWFSKIPCPSSDQEELAPAKEIPELEVEPWAAN